MECDKKKKRERRNPWNLKLIIRFEKRMEDQNRSFLWKTLLFQSWKVSIDNYQAFVFENNQRLPLTMLIDIKREHLMLLAFVESLSCRLTLSTPFPDDINSLIPRLSKCFHPFQDLCFEEIPNVFAILANSNRSIIRYNMIFKCIKYTLWTLWINIHDSTKVWEI